MFSSHSLDMRVSLFHCMSFFSIRQKYYEYDSVMNLHKISLTQGTDSMRLFGPDSVFIDDFLLVFATVLANELLTSFTFMNAL